MTYRETTVQCSYCGGSGRMASRYSDAGLVCPECSGEGEWPAECAECHEAKPLNDDGMCAECLMLTEVWADPFSRRVA